MVTSANSQTAQASQANPGALPATMTSSNASEYLRKADKLNGARILLQSLIAEGVDTMFGLPGGVILPLYEALPDYPQLKHILVRHEQGATHMAEGYAKATGRPGVALATSGPGATNVVTGLTNAYYDSTPIVVITGNVPSSMLGNDAFQEADIVGMTRACTKHNLIVRRVEDLAGAIKEAFYVATTGRPGPVLVDIPKDIFTAVTSFDYDATPVDLPGYRLTDERFTEADLDQLLALMAEARQPVLLCGGGVVSSGAADEVRAFVEHFRLPVGCSLMGLGGFPARHELYMGYTGMHGQYWANIAIANADVLLVVGNRLGERQTGRADRFARNARIIHIDLDAFNLNRNVQAALPIQGDIKRIFTRLNEKLADMTAETRRATFADTMASRDAWLEQIEGYKRRRASGNEGEGELPYLTPHYAIERLFHWLPEDGVVSTEVGQHQMWAAQLYNGSLPRTFITSGGLGTMGFGFPAAIGAQAAHPDRVVVDIAGDGSFQMTLQELATAKAAGLPVKVAVINNQFLGMIRQWQGKMFTRESEARLTSPDFVKLAEAYGCAGFRAETPEEVDDVIRAAYAVMDRPVIIDLRVAERADVYPWVPAGGSNDEMLTES
jgi:acetolactate synthase-1/2/3 large subunit